jgi:hypothetical protein
LDREDLPLRHPPRPRLPPIPPPPIISLARTAGIAAVAALALAAADSAAAAPVRAQGGFGDALHALLPGIFPAAPHRHRGRRRPRRKQPESVVRRRPPLPVANPFARRPAAATGAGEAPPMPRAAQAPALPLPRPATIATAAPHRPPRAGPTPPPTAPPAPRQKPAAAARPSSGPLLPAYDPACAALAAEPAVTYAPAAPIAQGRCVVPAPVRVTAIALADGGKVVLQPAPVTRCAMALALAAWVRREGAPAAAADLKAPLTGLRIADS